MATAPIDIEALTPEEQAELEMLMDAQEQYEHTSAEEKARLNERARLESDFTEFVKASWHVLEPGNKLSWSWHYNLIAEYLTLCADKKLKRLIINIPPRTLKSILVTVIFPVWAWTRNPTQSFLTASYADKLASEHSTKRRDLLESDWFKRMWGDKIWLARDQNEKTKYKNNYKAQMIATSVGGTATGLGGNFLVVDDGLKPDEIASEPAIVSLHNWFDNTWRSRLNNPAEDVMIIVEQRTGETDLTGHCTDGDKELVRNGGKPEWTHLCIPLEADEEVVDHTTLTQRFVFPISRKVKERKLGDVLQPDRFPVTVVASLKIRRLIWGTQYQGRPSPLGGNMIKRSEVRYYGGTDPVTQEADVDLPTKFDLILTSADCAFKDEKHSDYVAVGTVGVKGPNRYWLEVTNKHLDEPATRREILRQKQYWRSTVILVEEKANGAAVIKSLKRHVPGIIAIEPEGGKISRFFVAAGSWQAGNHYVSRTAAWAEMYVDQLVKFPGAKNDDMADMMSQAENYIERNTHVYGLVEYIKQQESEMAKKKTASIKKTIPANSTPEERKAILDMPIEKVENGSFAKPDTDDTTPRCERCSSTFIQRTPKGKRCGACGMEWGQPILNRSAADATHMGVLRK